MHYCDVLLHGAERENFYKGYIDQTEISFRMQACRLLAVKSVLAARMDLSRGDHTGEFGRYLRGKILRKIEKSLAKQPMLLQEKESWSSSSIIISKKLELHGMQLTGFSACEKLRCDSAVNNPRNPAPLGMRYFLGCANCSSLRNSSLSHWWSWGNCEAMIESITVITFLQISGT
ncbi:hypothetical protein K7X08_036437 [Anisodus acutangulus]|uniref:Nop domain-containing protein n=1 Tax=Anisodus acutangulus TaxID=402998 RepID=A0A9Q1QY25_9SOLA|nr:hypothetical protein K7X08_036437 [Anisodus acutangulus]